MPLRRDDRRRIRTGDIEEVVGLVFDLEQQVDDIERIQTGNRLSGPIRFRITPVGGNEYQCELINEVTGGTINLGTI